MIEITEVISDVDGSLTDGGVYYFDDGSRARKFSTFDGEGVRYLQEQGITVSLLTASDSDTIVHRAKWINVPVFTNVKDKYYFISRMFDVKHTAYFGNDVNDLLAMKLCAFIGCPADAHPEVLNHCKIRSARWEVDQRYIYYPISGFVSTRVGGQGAFREFADMLIANKFIFKSPRELQEEYYKFHLD